MGAWDLCIVPYAIQIKRKNHLSVRAPMHIYRDADMGLCVASACMPWGSPPAFTEVPV